MKRQNGFIAMMTAGFLAVGGGLAAAAPIVIDDNGLGASPGYSRVGGTAEINNDVFFDRDGVYFTAASQSATYSFAGLTAGPYEVFATWIGTGGGTTADYILNGGPAINKSQSLLSQADLLIYDADSMRKQQNNDVVIDPFPFEYIGTAYTAGSTLTVEVRWASGFTRSDAIAINRIPEPASLALFGLGGLLALRRRRR